MPSITRAIFLAIYAAALAFLVGSFGSAPALASPIPVPLPLIAAYRAQLPELAPRLLERSSISRLDSARAAAYDIKPASSIARRVLLDQCNLLSSQSYQIMQNAKTINDLAGQQPTGQADYMTAVSSFYGNVLGFQTTLSRLAAVKGLECYDKNDDLETLVKDTVNAIKYTLKGVSDIVNNLPYLGPILGPTVYEIKCILDETLDAVENLTDATVNALLNDVIAYTVKLVCDIGVQLGNLCVL